MNITRNRGDTYNHVFEVERSSTGVPVQIDGSSFKLSANNRREPNTANYSFQIIGIVTDGINGVVEFPFSAVIADNLGKFHYDIQMISAGETRTISQGTLIFKQDITK